MRFEKKRSTTKQEIPTASLPDIVFMLLLFFLVTSTLREHEVLVQFSLPEAEAIEKIENKRLVSYVWVGKAGGKAERIQVEDNIVTDMTEFADVMYQRRVKIPNLIVSMRVDKNSSMGIVTDLQQELRKIDARRLNYSTLLKVD